MERFLLPTPDYPPKRGGVARYLASLAQTFPTIRVVMWKGFPAYADMLKEFWRYRKSIDVILTSHVLPVGTAALLYRIMTRTPYDVMLHGLDFDGARSMFRKRVVMWCVLRGARRVFANSKALAAEVSIFSHRPCLVLYPCVSDAFVEASDLLVGKGNVHMPHMPIRLLTVGRLVERKGHQKVLRAMVDLPNTTYTIVGDGPMRNTLKREIVSRGLEERVTLLQHVSDGKLPELYASHHIFVMPTTRTVSDREGFGIVYLEAGVFAIPVVATAQPGVDEAVIDGETGILISDTPDALRVALARLCDDPSLRASLGTTARARVLALFTREKTMGAFGDIPPRVLNQQGNGVVSVVIPTYQHGKSIARCIDSVLSQTYPSIEIIVVDDGSTDETADVLERYGGKATIIHQENQGANPARNAGLARATGEFVIVTDADVVMKPGMIDAFVSALRSNPDARYAYSGFRFGWKKFHGVAFDAARLRTMNFVHTTSLVRRADFPGFDVAVKRFQDWDVWLSMLEKGYVGTLVPGTWFRVHVDGESRIGSSWLPSFVYQLPWQLIGWMPERVKRYTDARAAIAQKHHDV